MSRFLKTLFIWLVIASVPIQGMAAVVKASCGPRHHAVMDVAVTVMTAEHSNHHHDMGADHTHSASMAADAGDAASSATDEAPIVKSSYCSACAACCVGAAAPPVSSIRVPSDSNPESVVLSPEPLVTGFIPGGLERPPKHISA